MPTHRATHEQSEDNRQVHGIPQTHRPTPTPTGRRLRFHPVRCTPAPAPAPAPASELNTWTTGQHSPRELWSSACPSQLHGAQPNDGKTCECDIDVDARINVDAACLCQASPRSSQMVDMMCVGALTLPALMATERSSGT